MLTFLRRIRKSLIESLPSRQAGGATRKYILYAIGEILLVMIGILLALQVNNWNEWRKERVKEKKVLIDIFENLELNRNLLSDQIESLYNLTKSAEIIISVIENRDEYSDTLDYHFHKAQVNGYRFTLSKAGYEAFKNTGFEIITNEALQKDVIKLFEVVYPKLPEALGWGQEGSMWKAKYMDEQFLRINTHRGGGSMKPIDFEFLINDHYYFALLHKFNGQRRHFISVMDNCLSETQRVLQLIKDEMGDSK